METFKEPKALPCLHTFCLKCLASHCQNKNPKEVPCPLCRNNFSVPAGGLKNLPNDFRIHDLIEVQKLEKQKKSSMKYCDQHPDEQNRLYCNDCKVDMCHKCHESEHNKHAFSDFNESAEKFREQLKRDFDKVSICAGRKEKEHKQLDTDIKRFRRRVATTESEISQKYDQLISLIQSHKSQLMEELNILKDKILDEMINKKKESEIRCMTMERFRTQYEEIINKGTEWDISRMAHDLHARAEELVKTQDEPDCHQLSGVEITFTPSVVTIDSGKNFIGVLVLQGQNCFKLLATFCNIYKTLATFWIKT